MIAIDGSLTRTGFPFQYLMNAMLEVGKTVDTGHWQAVKNVPNTRTVELHGVVVEVPIQATPGSWAAYCRPNLPWAEDHFQERVAGEPLNPGQQFVKWPWYKPEWEAQDAARKFSHTYMERFWPQEAGRTETDRRIGRGINQGIRYRYGDLDDVLALLAKEPYTRQAYLPMFFPEDTGAHHGERIPCSLGWHFMLRDDKLHCFYPMRSVDLVRYLRDDAYMAGRLVQWVIESVKDAEHDMNPGSSLWDSVSPGALRMDMSSLHVFEDELPALRRKYAPDAR